MSTYILTYFSIQMHPIECVQCHLYVGSGMKLLYWMIGVLFLGEAYLTLSTS